MSILREFTVHTSGSTMLFHSGLVKGKNCQTQECYFRQLKCYLSKKILFYVS